MKKAVFVFLLVCGGLQTLFADEVSDYQIIRGLMRDGTYAIAVSRMETYLDQYPEGEHVREVHQLLVSACLSARFYERVHRYVSSYVERFCGTEEIAEGCIEVEVQNATAYYLESRYSEAEDILNGLANGMKERSVELRKTFYQLSGDVAFARNRYDASVDAYNDFLKIGFDNGVRLKLGIAYYHQKKYRRASRVLEGLAGEGFEDPQLYRYLGLIAFSDEDYAKAESLFRQAGQETDQIFRVHAMLMMNQGEQAYQLFRQVVPLEPVSQEDLTIFRIRTAVARMDLLKAQQLIQQTSLPDEPDVLGLAHQVYDQLRQFDRAAELLHRKALVSSNPGRDFYQLGEYVLTKLGDMKRAYQYYGVVLEKDPDGPYASLALMNRIKCALYMGDPDAALAQTTKFLSEYGVRSPITDQAYLILGKLMLQRGTYDEAVKSFENIVANYPESNLRQEASYLLVDSYFRMGMYKDAVQAASAGVPEQYQAQVLHMAGVAAYLAGDDALAVQLLEKLKTLDRPDFPTGIFVATLARAGRLEDAVAAASGNAEYQLQAYRIAGDMDGMVNVVVSEDPQNPDRLYRVAGTVEDTALKTRLLTAAVELSDRGTTVHQLALIELEPLLIAAGAYREMMELEPAFIQNDPAGFHGAQAILKKARAYREKEKLAKAVSMYQMAVSLYPDAPGNDEAYYFLFEFARPQKPEYLEKIVSIYPDGEYGALAAYKLGLLRFQADRFGEAVGLLEQALQSDNPAMDELRFVIHYYLGVAEERLGKTDAALNQYRRYLAALPADAGQVDERVRIGLLFQKEEQFAEALDIFRRLLQREDMGERKAELTYYAAECLEGLGRLDEALQEYLAVTYLHSDELMWSTTARFRAARICEQLEYYDDAIKLYRKIAESHKGQIQGDFARRKLETLEQQKGNVTEPVQPPE